MINNDQLREITAIIDRLEQSRFGYLELKLGDLHVTIGTSDPAAGVAASAPAVALAGAPAGAATVAVLPVDPAVLPTQTLSDAAPVQAPRGKPILAPMVGRFYARPEPGADLYVKVGDVIQADATIGLVEVMKVFNGVTAGVAGRVTHIAVAEGDFVEFDQALMYVEEISS